MCEVLCVTEALGGECGWHLGLEETATATVLRGHMGRPATHASRRAGAAAARPLAPAAARFAASCDHRLLSTPLSAAHLLQATASLRARRGGAAGSYAQHQA